MVDLANDLLRKINSLEHITICSAIYREDKFDNNKLKLRDTIKQYNGFLAHLCEVEPRIRYHVHSGYWLHSVSTWSRDGIHPNTILGRKKYKRSLRSAVFKAITSARKNK